MKPIRRFGERSLVARGPVLFPSSPLGTWVRGCTERRHCRPGSCPHRGVPCGCVWPVASHLFTGSGLLSLSHLAPPCPRCLWEPITTSPFPASLPSPGLPPHGCGAALGFHPQSSSPAPALPSVKAARGSASHFQDFKKPKGKSYIYLNEVPRLNKTLSVFALGWSLSTQCGILTDQKH